MNPVSKMYIILKMFHTVPYVKADLSWKFSENSFIHFIVMLLTDMPPRLDRRPWGNLVRRETV